MGQETRPAQCSGMTPERRLLTEKLVLAILVL